MSSYFCSLQNLSTMDFAIGAALCFDYCINLDYIIEYSTHLERCPSGLRSTLGRRAYLKRYRGFESPPFRIMPRCYAIVYCKTPPE